MSIQEKIMLLWIHLSIHPFNNEKPVSFTTKIKKANRVLIICPDSIKIEDNLPILEKLAKLFSKKRLAIVYPGRDKENMQSRLKFPITYLNLDKQNYWSLTRSQAIKTLSKSQFDVLLDLDPRFRLLNIYLCRLLVPSVRICFVKPYSDRFYNLTYNFQPGTSYNHQLDSLYHFIQTTIG